MIIPSQKMLARFLAAAVTILMFATTPAFAVAEDASALPKPSPDKLIRDAVKSFKKNLRNIRGKSLQERIVQARKHIDEHVTPHTDFRLMTERVFADHWEDIEREGLVDVAISRIRAEYLRIQVNAIAKFKRRRIRVFDAKIEGEYARVHVTIRAMKTVTVDVFLHLREDGHWKIYDMAIIGSSFVESMKSGYGDLIAEHGLKVALLEDTYHFDES